MSVRIGQLIAFFFRSLFWSLNLLLSLFTLLGYWLLYSLPTEHWSAGMVMISIPVVWVLNLVCVIFWLITRPWRSWLSAIVLILGVVLFGQRTFAWNTTAGTPPAGIAVKVFSYNVLSFGLENYWERRYSSPKARRIINYVLRYDAPIKCFQEFHVAAGVPDYDVVRRFREAGYRYSVFLHPEAATSNDGAVGAAIFSIYPIIHSDREVFNTNNGLVWANIKVGNDTIRIINVHLQSMGIRVGNVLVQDKLTGVKHETRGVLSALRYGFIERREQIQRVERHIRESQYPVIVTGDHNDTPYSVVYERMRRILPNSFEEAGHGFGFTYNRLPGFIRIDHQFHDPDLPVLNFETINYVRYSDHYPIAGTYLVK
ncbi:endonuclease/exonuclease/phosphatase family protein [Spirosoma taeanense]|uniref:Endonuclease/exonuclease/phosphatase family protein n=1 Tax=Spirosoma taeanense TaxID=2735870 RepID=A0A6M5YFZ5_9BACT|nr:endonuclease/exonuclease/phosphatase family protein [Spirosoma taeanense]